MELVNWEIVDVNENVALLAISLTGENKEVFDSLEKNINKLRIRKVTGLSVCESSKNVIFSNTGCQVYSDDNKKIVLELIKGNLQIIIGDLNFIIQDFNRKTNNKKLKKILVSYTYEYRSSLMCVNPYESLQQIVIRGVKV